MGERRKRTDFHLLDQSLRQGETMAYVLVCQHGSRQVAHNLMHLDQDASVLLQMKSHRLYMRIDLAPLFRPVGAHGLRTFDKTAFERSRPSQRPLSS